LKAGRLVTFFPLVIAIAFPVSAFAQDPAPALAAQARLTARTAAKRPTPSSRFARIAANQAVIGGEWDFFISGSRLSFRAGSAPMTERFQSIALPSAGQKLSADSQNVYVWLDALHIMSYAIGDSGPSPNGVARSGDDGAANLALARPYVSASRKRVQAAPSTIVTISPQRLFTANSGLDSVTAIDTSSNAILQTFSLVPGANPQDIQVSPSNQFGYTANGGGGSTCTSTSGCLSLGAQSFDPLAMSTAGNTVPAASPFAVTFSPDATTLYVADDLTVHAYSTSTGASTASGTTSAFTWGMYQTPDGSTLYTIDDDDYFYEHVSQNDEPVNAISVFTTPGLSGALHYRIPAGSQNSGDGLGCYSITASPTTGNIYVACDWEDYQSPTPAVYEISVAGGQINILNTFNTAGSPVAVAFSPDGSKLYVAMFNSNTIVVMDPNTGTQLATIPVGQGPTSIAVNSTGNRGYVANFTSGTVSVLDLTANTVIATVTLPAGAAPVAASLTYAPPGSIIGNVAATVNGASFASATPVAVGSLVSLFGSAIGPATSASASATPLPTTLGGYQVKIGGIFAPLLFASSGQINAQVPFELAGQSSTTVSVTNGTATSSNSTVSLAASAPGIFVGAGTQGAVLNQDFSANSAANPAARGSVVQIFATGQGVVSNQPADGAAASTSVLATTSVTPVVIIGGVVAQVQFSGLAQGFVGLWQVNAVVPSTVATGGAVSLQIIMNTISSNVVSIGVK